ncbi:MAG: ATP synthase F0 subunit B [Desulfobulbaceae bacterium]|nr:ATP synthase F0 subunit B [Desulfobulbaceae bacterium]
MKLARKSTLTLLGAAALIVGLTVLAQAAGHGEGGHGEGGIPTAKWLDLLWRTTNFTGLVIILVWALKKPFTQGLQGRRQGIIDKFADLEAQKGEAERIYREYEARLTKIDAEVEAIVSAAVKHGEAEKERLIAEADRAAGDIRRQAELSIQHELAEARLRLRGEVAEQAVALAEELIKQNLQDADQNRMVEDYLDKVGAIQ